MVTLEVNPIKYISIFLIVFLLFSFLTVTVFAESDVSDVSDVSELSSESEQFSNTDSLPESYYLERIYICLFILTGITFCSIFISHPRRF